MIHVQRRSGPHRPVAAALFSALALAAAALGLLLLPPVLEGFVLASGHLGSATERVAGWVLGALCLVGAWRAGRRAVRCWRSPSPLPPRQRAFRAITVVAGVALVVALLELLARAVVPLDRVLYGDAFHRFIWLEARERAARSQKGAGLNPAVPADRHDPRLGWVPRAGFTSERVNVNADGLRGTREHPRAKPPGERRIVVTGDSFTFGEDVADDEVYTEVLDRMLPGSRVVNLGVHGYGTDQQVLRLIDQGFDYDPDLVVLAYYKPNSGRNVLRFRDYAKPRFRLHGGELRLEGTPVPGPDDPRLAEPPRPVSWLGSLVGKSLGKAWAHTRFAPEWPLTRAILDRAVAECERRGVPFLLVYIPAARPRLSPVPEDAEAVLEAWAADRGVAMLNLRPAFLELPAERRDGLYAGHWTPAGHRLAAGLIARRIAAEGWLARPPAAEAAGNPTPAGGVE